MLDKKSIMLLYEEGRYDSAVLAMEKTLRSAYRDLYVIAVEADKLIPWKKTSLERKVYVFSIRNLAWIHKIVSAGAQWLAPLRYKQSKKPFKPYKNPQKETFTVQWKKKYRRFDNLIIRFDPEIIVCATPALLRKACKAKNDQKKSRLEIYGMMTDYTVDKRFLHAQADGYLVQNDMMAQNLADLGFPKEKILTVGTPISEQNQLKFSRETVMSELGIENRLNIVMIGGRYGAESLKNIFTACAEQLQECNFIVVSGKSAGLVQYCDYIARTKNKEKNLYVVEEIDNVAKLFAIADVIVCTPTAQLTAEAVLHRVPIIVVKGADKVEKGNAHYLTNNLLALRGENAEETVSGVLKLLEDASTADEISEKQKDYGALISQIGWMETLYETATALHTAKQEDAQQTKKIELPVTAIVKGGKND